MFEIKAILSASLLAFDRLKAMSLFLSLSLTLPLMIVAFDFHGVSGPRRASAWNSIFEPATKPGAAASAQAELELAGVEFGSPVAGNGPASRPDGTCIPRIGIQSWHWWRTFLRWSPDGREILVTRGPVLHSATVDGTSVRTIVRGPVDHLDVMSTMLPFDTAPDSQQAVIAVCTYPLPVLASVDRVGEYGQSLEWELRKYDSYGYELALVDLADGHPPALGHIDADDELAFTAAASGSSRRLTANTVFDGFPAWSPDGRRVAFLQGLIDGSEYYEGARRLAALSPDAGDPQVLVVHDGDEFETGLALHPPSWSPDGRRIAFAAAVGRTQVGLFTVPVDGAAPRRLSFLRPLAATMSAPAWSPDGQRLAFASVEDDVLALFAIAVDGSDRRRVADIRAWEPSSVPGRAAWSPRYFGTIGHVAWSPDGTKLLFTYSPVICVVTREGLLIGQATYYVPAKDDEDDIACLAPHRPKFAGVPPGWANYYKSEAVAAWSPSGERIAFAFALADSFHYEDSRDVELRLYTMAPDGSDVRPVARMGSGNQLAPGISGSRPQA